MSNLIMPKIRPISSFKYSYSSSTAKAEQGLEDLHVNDEGDVDYRHIDKLWIDNQDKNLRDFIIYSLHEHEGFTYQKIGKALGVSGGRVRQIMKKERVKNAERLLQLSKFYARYLLRGLNKNPN